MNLPRDLASLPDSDPVLRLPSMAVIAAGVRNVSWIGRDGEIETLTLAAAASRLKERAAAPLVCHARGLAARLGIAPFPAYDLLELFAFVRPARFCLPTPRGVARALGLDLPATITDEAAMLAPAARLLLGELTSGRRPRDPDALPVARAMAQGGWPWAEAVMTALGGENEPIPAGNPARGLRVWTRLPEWEERPPEPAPDSRPVTEREARDRLADILSNDPAAEARPEQADYTAAAAAAFAPRGREGEPNVVLAEAGTGVGKTLGYLAPASLWSAKNGGPVWISTYTRNLQRQLDAELDRLYPDQADKEYRVVVRKGRENYLCLLNYAEAAGGLLAQGGDAIALGLMARWIKASRDGDMVGGDFPAWLSALLGRSLTLDLTDTRGECIYSACEHYQKCFIERGVRRARSAEIVVANHALVMIHAALGGGDEGTLPTRFVFDEGHHLFDAADGAFSAHLSGLEAAELRRWLLGAEGRRGSRARGLSARLGDLIGGDEAALEALDEALRAARALPGPAWQQRVSDGLPTGACEEFLALVRTQVYARDPDARSPYGLECSPHPPIDRLNDAATALAGALIRLAKPLADLKDKLTQRLDDEAETLDESQRRRIDALARSIDRRGVRNLEAWRDMLAALIHEAPADFVDWFGVERIDGRDIDVGFHRHWLDPTRPLMEAVSAPAHGVLVTSASLRDGTGDHAADWQAAEARTGARHLVLPAEEVMVPSPFDYPAVTRVLIVTDIGRGDMDQTAAAYRELFVAAGGGGLGLFTAIARLRAVHARIAGAIDEAGLPLLAQHVDPLDVGTLIDIFRTEEDACLLGTDAVRDGVDVPGRSLRLIVFDRVPWPRPDILHKARRQASGGRGYDEMLTRLRLKQAFGRLIRRDGDRGVFVMLDRSLPSRLLGAFPEGVSIQRVGLAQAIADTRAFLTKS